MATNNELVRLLSLVTISEVYIFLVIMHVWFNFVFIGLKFFVHHE